MPSGNWLPFEMLPSEMLFSGLYFFLLIILLIGLTGPRGGRGMYWQGAQCAFALGMWALGPGEQPLPGEGRIIPLSARRAVRVAAALWREAS